MDKDEIDALAQLCRIDIPDKEKEGFTKDFERILDYVKQVESINAQVKEEEEYLAQNVMREDVEPYESGIYSREILDEAPSTKDGYVKVQKIL